uniref:hemagglutinin repeat-containing protein n=1 Tax=Snodgrassella gandavensis TaxID=2946698 RepID=UPI001EF40B47
MAALGQGYMAYSTGKNIQDASLIKIESGIGFKSSKSQQDSSYRLSQANQLTAGGNINLISREGDIRLQNTQANAKDSINLNSARDIILEAGQNQQKADGKNSSAGLSVGVGASIGAQTGVYIYGEAGVSSGKNHLDAKTHSQTTLQSDKLSLTSKGNTTLMGAQASANRIDANIGGKLSIISPQDKIDQKISQSGANLH